MEKEYTISTGWKAFMIIVAIFLIGFALFLFSMGEGKNNTPLIFILPGSILLGAVWIIAQQLRKKVIIITNESIKRIDAFSTREIAIKDINGCRVGQKVIYIEPLSPANSKITISNYDVLNNSDELVQYFKDNFKDLDMIDLERVTKEALQNPEYGATEIDRKKTIKKAKIIGWIYNIAGMILGFSIVFIDNSKATVLLLLYYPIVGIIIMLLSKGLIKFLSNSKRSVYGFIMLGFFMPCFVLFIKSLSEYTLADYSNLWLPFLLISAIFFISLYITGINKTVEAVKGQVVIMLIFGLIYGFGCTRQINCVFDNSSPKIIHTTVNSKWIEHSKGEHYYLKLNPLDADTKPKDIEVSSSTYNKYEPGNAIDVELKQGLLNIPWYYLAQ